MNNVRMIWTGSWVGTEYLVEVNGRQHSCGQSGMFNLQFHPNEDAAARCEAQQWLLCYNIDTNEFDPFKEPWVFGGTL